MAIRPPTDRATSLASTKATREAGFDSTQAAVPDCLSPTSAPIARMAAPTPPIWTPSRKNSISPSSKALPPSACSAVRSRGSSSGAIHSGTAMRPLTATSQTPAWMRPKRVPNHGRSSCRSRLPSPLVQPWAAIGRSATLIAGCDSTTNVSTAMGGCSFDQTEEDLFQVVFLAAELGDGDARFGGDQRQQLRVGGGRIGHGDVQVGAAVAGSDRDAGHPGLPRDARPRAVDVAPEL